MANPQPKDAHLRIAHSITEEIMMRDFTKRQRSILDFILRLSWGCGKKEAVIPRMKYFELCGISQTKIKTELHYLVNAQVIEWNEKTNQFSFNKNYDDWKISIVKGYDKDLLSEIIHINLVDKYVDNNVDGMCIKKKVTSQNGNELPKRGRKFPFWEP